MSDSIINLTKCINCGATLVNERCEYCNTDYKFTMNFAEKISHASDPKLKGYYKILDVAFNSQDYDESYNYANKILELDPDNKDIWGIKIYSSIHLLSVAQFEAGGWQTALKQLVNTNAEYAYKILDAIFNFAVTSIIYDARSNLYVMLNVTHSCLDRGMKDREAKAKILYHAVDNRNLAFPNQFQNKPTILYNIRNKYFSAEENKKAAKSDRLGFMLGIASIPLCFFGIFGLLGLYFSFKTLKKNKSGDGINAAQEKKFANYGLGLSVVGIVLSLIVIASIIFGEPVEDKPNIKFEEMAKLEIRDKNNTDPNIYIYKIKIESGEDSAKIEEAIKDKIEMDPVNSLSYYFYETMPIPSIRKDDEWKTVYDKCKSSNPVATSQVDTHQKMAYRISDKNGALGESVEYTK